MPWIKQDMCTNKQKKVSERTLAAITAAEDRPAEGIDAAIDHLSGDQGIEAPKG